MKCKILSLIAMSLIAINSTSVFASTIPTECIPNPIIEFVGTDLLYNPRISANCTAPDMDHYLGNPANSYELLEVDVWIERRHYIGDTGFVQQETIHIDRWFAPTLLEASLHDGVYYNFGGGINIDGYTIGTMYEYRVGVAVTWGFVPFETAEGEIDIWDYRMHTEWTAGPDVVTVSPTFDGIPDEFDDQPNPDDEIPDRPADPQINPDLDDVPDQFVPEQRGTDSEPNALEAPKQLKTESK